MGRVTCLTFGTVTDEHGKVSRACRLRVAIGAVVIERRIPINTFKALRAAKVFAQGFEPGLVP